MLVIAYPYMTFFYNVMIHVQQMAVDGLSSRLLVTLGLARSNLMLYLGQIIQSFYISCSLMCFSDVLIRYFTVKNCFKICRVEKYQA